MSGQERAKYLYRIARIIQERGRELAVLESIDNGKPVTRIALTPHGRQALHAHAQSVLDALNNTPQRPEPTQVPVAMADEEPADDWVD